MRRRLLNADCEVDLVVIDDLELEQTWRKARQSEGTGAPSFSCWSFYLNYVSVRFGFGFDDVGRGTCVAVECPDPVVIECVRSQPSYRKASHIANIQIVVGWHESTKRV